MRWICCVLALLSLVVSTTVTITGITTLKVDDVFLTERGRNFVIVKSWMRRANVLEWLVFVTGSCEKLYEMLDFVRCVEIPSRMTLATVPMPLAGHLLRHARRLAKGTHLMYLNMDVVVLGNLTGAIHCVQHHVHAMGKAHVMITSYTWAWAAARTYDFGLQEDADAFREALDAAERYEEPGWGTEYFIIDRRSPLIDRFPPLLIGRRRWDNAVMQISALHPQIVAVDGTAMLKPAHLHHGHEGGKDWRTMVASGSDYNDIVAKYHGGWNFGNVYCMNFHIAEDRCQLVERDIRTWIAYDSDKISALVAHLMD